MVGEGRGGDAEPSAGVVLQGLGRLRSHSLNCSAREAVVFPFAAWVVHRLNFGPVLRYPQWVAGGLQREEPDQRPQPIARLGETCAVRQIMHEVSVVDQKREETCAVKLIWQQGV